MEGARMIEEVGELELGEGLLEGKLRESGESEDVVRMRMIGFGYGCPKRGP
jgi:hypothetical protein